MVCMHKRLRCSRSTSLNVTVPSRAGPLKKSNQFYSAFIIIWSVYRVQHFISNVRIDWFMHLRSQWHTQCFWCIHMGRCMTSTLTSLSSKVFPFVANILYEWLQTQCLCTGKQTKKLRQEKANKHTDRRTHWTVHGAMKSVLVQFDKSFSSY